MDLQIAVAEARDLLKYPEDAAQLSQTGWPRHLECDTICQD